MAGDKVHGDKIVNDASQTVNETINNSPGATVNTSATNQGTVNPDAAKIIEKVNTLAAIVRKSSLSEFQKEDVQAWIKESIDELQKDTKDRRPGKLEYTWGKIVDVLKGAKEVYDAASAILGPLIPVIAPNIASKL